MANSKLSPDDMKRRHTQIEIALGNQHLEGLKPDHLTVETSRRWANGEISIQEAIADFKDRMKLLARIF